MSLQVAIDDQSKRPYAKADRHACQSPERLAQGTFEANLQIVMRLWQKLQEQSTINGKVTTGAEPDQRNESAEDDKIWRGAGADAEHCSYDDSRVPGRFAANEIAGNSPKQGCLSANISLVRTRVTESTCLR